MNNKKYLSGKGFPALTLNGVARNLSHTPIIIFFILCDYTSRCFCIGMPISGRSEALSGAYSMAAEGFDCIEWNPANLGIGPKFSFNILTIGATYYANLPYSYYMSLAGKHLTKEDKIPLLNGQDINISGKAQSLSFSINPEGKRFGIAFSTYLYYNIETYLPAQVCSLFLLGNELDRTYSFKNIKAEEERTVAISFSYGKLFKPLSIGFTIKYLYALSYRKIEDSYGSLYTNFDYITADGGIIYKYADGGRGFGIDFGIIYVSDFYKFGISIINLINQINWNVNPTRRVFSFKLDTTNVENFDPNTTLKWTDSTYQGKSFYTNKHPILHVGWSIKPRVFYIFGDVGFPTRISLGMEIPIIRFLEIRYGISFYKERFWFGAGIGIKSKPCIDLGVKINSNSKLSGAITIAGFIK